MIILHHLNNSRSHRILWLLEELGAPYELKSYQRLPGSQLAPPELNAMHPLGKAPMLEDKGRLIIESAAIVDYLIRHYGQESGLRPGPENPAHEDYLQWLHYAEGSAVQPFILHLYVSRLGEAGKPLQPRIEGEIGRHLSYLEASLRDRPYLLGDALTGADILMSFVAEIAGAFGKRAPYPAVGRWIAALQARPAYQAALERGGPYAFKG
ncbi:MAG TPA: glutathione S-transferase family protein [Azospirillaceae bacterium]|nr:glutathione S-transferase family protein [Azospirillaceae bacterium]